MMPVIDAILLASTRPPTLAEIEANAIREALERTGGNKRRAAVELGIALKTLYNKLHRYRIAGFGEDADAIR